MTSARRTEKAVPRRRMGYHLMETIEEEDAMGEIRWTKDVDAALKEAKATRKPVLLDFSAAPM